MSVTWSVLPFDPTTPEFGEWLEDKGVAVPDKAGRYPRWDEIVNVLETFGDLPVSKEQVTENLWDVTVGELYTATYADLLGTIEDDGSFNFHFEKGSKETTMLEILKRLAERCGPLVLWDDYSATPVLITSTTIVDTALAEWHQRMATGKD